MLTGRLAQKSEVNPHLEAGVDYLEVWQDGSDADHCLLASLHPVASLSLGWASGPCPLLVPVRSLLQALGPAGYLRAVRAARKMGGCSDGEIH